MTSLIMLSSDKNGIDNDSSTNEHFCSDILCREALEETKRKNKSFHLWYTIDRPKGDWNYSTGFINKEMISKNLPSPGSDTLILMCGPPPMIKFACLPALEELGYSEDMLFAF